jgi:hypothetical protein
MRFQLNQRENAVAVDGFYGDTSYHAYIKPQTIIIRTHEYLLGNRQHFYALSTKSARKCRSG